MSDPGFSVRSIHVFMVFSFVACSTSSPEPEPEWSTGTGTSAHDSGDSSTDSDATTTDQSGGDFDSSSIDDGNFDSFDSSVDDLPIEDCEELEMCEDAAHDEGHACIMVCDDLEGPLEPCPRRECQTICTSAYWGDVAACQDAYVCESSSPYDAHCREQAYESAVPCFSVCETEPELEACQDELDVALAECA